MTTTSDVDPYDFLDWFLAQGYARIYARAYREIQSATYAGLPWSAVQQRVPSEILAEYPGARESASTPTRERLAPRSASEADLEGGSWEDDPIPYVSDPDTGGLEAARAAPPCCLTGDGWRTATAAQVRESMRQAIRTHGAPVVYQRIAALHLTHHHDPAAADRIVWLASILDEVAGQK